MPRLKYKDPTSGEWVSLNQKGDPGKSAYQYAQEAGYSGTESEFAGKLAEEIPTKTSQLTNDSNFITASGAPVQSVNGKTGVVSLTASDVGALPDTTVIPTVPINVSAFTNDAGYLTEHQSLDGYATEDDIPTALPNPYVLTINGTSYDGSATVNMTESVNALIDAKLSAITNAEEVAF